MYQLGNKNKIMKNTIFWRIKLLKSRRLVHLLKNIIISFCTTCLQNVSLKYREKSKIVGFFRVRHLGVNNITGSSYFLRCETIFCAEVARIPQEINID
eukprot:UN09973